MTSEREAHLEKVLAQFLKPVKGIPFEVIIKSLSSCSVMPFDRSNSGLAQLLKLIAEATRDACEAVAANPIERPRPNEVGNDMEAFLISSMNASGLKAGPPKTRDGKGKSAGYPDIKIETTPHPVFVEVKTLATAKPASSFRSFYLSPTESPKVFEDGYHLLVAFEIVRSGNAYRPIAFEIVDLYGLECDMKFEFNSDNKRIYEERRVLARERI